MRVHEQCRYLSRALDRLGVALDRRHHGAFNEDMQGPREPIGVTELPRCGEGRDPPSGCAPARRNGQKYYFL